MDCLKPLRAHKHPIAPPRLSTASKPIEPRVTSKKDTVLSSGVAMGGRPERHPLKSSSRAMEAGRSIQVRIEHARYRACERDRRRGTIADREAGGDPQRGPQGHFPADEDVQRTPAHRRGRQAAARCPESMDCIMVPWAVGAVVSAEQHSQWHGGTLSRAPSRAASFKSRRSSCAIIGLIAQLKGIAGRGGSPARAYVHLYRYTYFFVFCVKSLFFSM